MLKVKKRAYPLNAEGELNQAWAEIERQRNDMTVKGNVPKGGLFILHDVIYQAVRALPQGTEAKPGDNCVAKSLNEMNGGN